ncbi:hypothetical protein JHD50_07815 [Sulfurimonas sp. MAG313]|nr:hypothetical protein [Sulfurimonas sp. MAG313]MDF1881209.1 hypothetical protein [Sulfurimonas sp. MAG313]
MSQEDLVRIELMMERIVLKDFGVHEAQFFLRNNPIFLQYFLDKKGYSIEDIGNFYNNNLMVAEVSPTEKEYKHFFKLTSKSYKKGTKKLFVVLNNIDGLTKMYKRGVTLLPISFYELLETNINQFKRP